MCIVSYLNLHQKSFGLYGDVQAHQITTRRIIIVLFLLLLLNAEEVSQQDVRSLRRSHSKQISLSDRLQTIDICDILAT